MPPGRSRPTLRTAAARIRGPAGAANTWEPIWPAAARLMHQEPVINVMRHRKAYLSLRAEELLGVPDRIVFLALGEARAVRPALPGDAVGLTRALDPHRTVCTGGLGLPPGIYRLSPDEGGAFRLEPAASEKTKDRRTRREMRL